MYTHKHTHTDYQILSEDTFRSHNPLDSDYNSALLYHSAFAVANIKRNGKHDFNNLILRNPGVFAT